MQIIVGRGRDTDYRVSSDYMKVSAQHLIIEERDGQLYMKDVGSRNGTYLNGEAIVQNKLYRITPQDDINLGNQYLLDWEQVKEKLGEAERKLARPVEPHRPEAESETPEHDIIYRYGGFWVRFGAAFIDGIILSPIYSVLMVLFTGFGLYSFRLLTFNLGSVLQTLLLSNLFLMIFLIVVGWLYFALLESSRYQGTLGKKLFNLIVTTDQLQRLSFAHASGRYFAKIISFIPYLFGFIMVGFHPEKRALHDVIAQTRIIRHEKKLRYPA